MRPNPNPTQPKSTKLNPKLILKNWTQNPDDFEISAHNPAQTRILRLGWVFHGLGRKIQPKPDSWKKNLI